MPQVLAVAGFELDGRPYAAGSVVTISDSSSIMWLKGRKLVEDDSTAVSSAISGGAAQIVHIPSLSDVSVLPIENWKQSNTSTLQYMARASGYQRSNLLFNGDSYFQGRKAAGNGDVGARKFSIPVLIAQALTTLGYPCNSDSVCGWLAVSPTTVAGYAAYDSRVTYSGAVISLPGYAGLGYQIWQIPAAGTVTFTPGGTFDTIDVYWPALAGAGTFTVSDGGGVKATIDSSASPGAMRSQTVTLAAGTTSVTFTSSSGNSNIAYWKVRTAASPGIEMMMAGGAGLPVQQFAPTAAAAPYGTQASVNILTSGLKCTSVIDGWYNDFASGRTITQFKNDLRTETGFLKGKGDVIYINYGKLKPASVDESTFQAWTAAAKSVVINEFDCPWIDVSQIISDNALAYSSGYMNSDLIHFEKAGHALVRDLFIKAFRSLI